MGKGRSLSGLFYFAMTRWASRVEKLWRVTFPCLIEEIIHFSGQSRLLGDLLTNANRTTQSGFTSTRTTRLVLCQSPAREKF
jgi:hypothetical protein